MKQGLSISCAWLLASHCYWAVSVVVPTRQLQPGYSDSRLAIGETTRDNVTGLYGPSVLERPEARFWITPREPIYCPFVYCPSDPRWIDFNSANRVESIHYTAGNVEVRGVGFDSNPADIVRAFGLGYELDCHGPSHSRAYLYSKEGVAFLHGNRPTGFHNVVILSITIFPKDRPPEWLHRLFQCKYSVKLEKAGQVELLQRWQKRQAARRMREQEYLKH